MNRFEKSLYQLIVLIRANNKNSKSLEKCINQSISECRTEIQNPDLEMKSMAALKLAYLEMYGYDMSWSNFHVLEVMSSNKPQQRRIGYLSAIQSFRNDEDVLMLATNLFKKDLSSGSVLDVSLALSGIATVVTPSLATDISDDVVKMLNHSTPYIRKKAVLAMYKIFLQFPEALRSSFDRLKDKLDDPNPSVVSATVTVICELAKRHPKNYLPLAPQLYQLLNTSNNNWMLIRILKLFSSLSLIEPRLKNKLLSPIIDLIQKTKASSLIYECINCIITGGLLDNDDYETAGIIVPHLQTFLDQDDHNLKYVGLLALVKISKIQPFFIKALDEQVLTCLYDSDISIRQQALELVSSIVDYDNITDIVQKLLLQLVPGLSNDEEDDDGDKYHYNDENLVLPESYKADLIHKIIEICSFNTFSNIPNFDWYITVLVDLTTILGDNLTKKHREILGYEIGEQLRNVSIRIPSIREKVVIACVKIINDFSMIEKLPSVLGDSIFIIGEFSSKLLNPEYIIELIVEKQWLELTNLEMPNILSIYIQSIIKLFSNFVNNNNIYWDFNKFIEIENIIKLIISFFEKFSKSCYFEVQERSVEFLELFKVIQDAVKEHDKNSNEPPLIFSLLLPSLFNEYELKPVAPGTQERIGLPEDLDLDTEINVPLLLSDSENDDDSDDIQEELEENDEVRWESTVNGVVIRRNSDEEKRKLERLERQKYDPFYISYDASSTPQSISSVNQNEFQNSNTSLPNPLSNESLDVDDIPTVKLNLYSTDVSSSKKDKKKKKSKSKLARQHVTILQDETIPGDNFPIQSSSFNRNSPSLNVKSKKKNILKFGSSELEKFNFDDDFGENDELKIKEVSPETLEIEKIRENINKETNKIPEYNNINTPIVKKKKKKAKSHKSENIDDEDTVGVKVQHKKLKKKKKRAVIQDKQSTDETV